MILIIRESRKIIFNLNVPDSIKEFFLMDLATVADIDGHYTLVDINNISIGYATITPKFIQPMDAPHFTNSTRKYTMDVKFHSASLAGEFDFRSTGSNDPKGMIRRFSIPIEGFDCRSIAMPGFKFDNSIHLSGMILDNRKLFELLDTVIRATVRDFLGDDGSTMQMDFFLQTLIEIYDPCKLYHNPWDMKGQLHSTLVAHALRQCFYKTSANVGHSHVGTTAVLRAMVVDVINRNLPKAEICYVMPTDEIYNEIVQRGGGFRISDGVLNLSCNFTPIKF